MKDIRVELIYRDHLHVMGEALVHDGTQTKQKKVTYAEAGSQTVLCSDEIQEAFEELKVMD